MYWNGSAYTLTLQKTNDSSGNTTEKYYVGGIKYAGTVTSNITVEAIYHSEGRLTPNGSGYRYEYTLKDHLGNARVSFTDIDNDGNVDQSEVLQTNHYYPFGMRHEGKDLPQQGVTNAYQYNGKELNSDFGLDWLDYGARWYDASIGRFSVIDRFAEKYYDLGGYHYVANNPVNAIDINGDSLWIVHKGEKILYEGGQLYYENGDTYNGSGVKVKKDGTVKYKGFLKHVMNALSELENTNVGGTAISELEVSNNNFKIVKGKKNKFRAESPSDASANLEEIQYVTGNSRGSNGSGGTIFFNPKSKYGGFNSLGSRERPNFIALGHEIFHAQDANDGLLYPSNDYTNVVTGAEYYASSDGVLKAEISAVYRENILRMESYEPLRTHYGVTQTSSGLIPSAKRLLDVNNTPIKYYPNTNAPLNTIPLPSSINP